MGQGKGKGQKVSMPSPGTLLSQHIHMFINLEALQTQSFWGCFFFLLGFYDGFITWA